MIGKTISHYKILEKIGEGGMGVVYKAQDTRLDRIVALKFLPEHSLADKDTKTRFAHEAKAASAIDHPNISTVHDIDEVEGKTFISMAFVDGKSLKELARDGGLSIQEIIKIGVQAAEGLGAAHKKGIVHRDVKSDNLMLTSGGHVKVMDFGLAKLKGATGLTKAGQTVGTAYYMSPEQTKGEEVDHRSDIFSLGVVLYELISGQLPFTGEYDPAIAYSIINEQPEPLRELRADVPAELEGIVMKALEKESANRYQSMGEIISDLRNLWEGRTSEIRAAVPSGPPRLRFLVPVGAFILLAAIVLMMKLMPAGRAPVETTDSTLAVMYFDNMVDAGDTGRLGEIVANLLITDLSDSRFVKVVSSQRLYDILKNMGQEGVKVIDRSVASQVAKKAQARWMLLGSILQTDPYMVVTSQLVDVNNGNIIESQRITGADDEEVFSIVDRLTVEVKKDLKLPDEALEEPDAPVAEVTTAFPEAYRHYIEGIDYFNMAYMPEAQESFSRAIEIDSTFAMAYFRLAVTMLSGRQAEGFKMIDKALQYSDRVTKKEQYFIRGFKAFLTGDSEQGINSIRRIIEQYPDEKEAYFWLGTTYYQQRDFTNAIPMLTKAVEIDPTYKFPYNMLAYCYDAVGDFEKSIWAINKYISIAPDEANPYDTRGELYAQNGRIDLAIDSYEKALEKKPDFAPSLRALGKLWMHKGEYEVARSYFGRLASSSDKATRIDGRTLLAFIPLYRGQFDRGLEMLDGAIAADTVDGQEDLSTATIHGIKADVHREKGDLDSALREVETVREIVKRVAPDLPIQFDDYYGYILSLRGETDKAEKIAAAMREKILSSDPSRMYDYWQLMGEIERARGDVQKAVEYMERSNELAHGQSFGTRLGLARLYLEAGRLGDAVGLLEGALAKYDDARTGHPVQSAKLHYMLGKAYEGSGWIGKAIAQYEEYLEIMKDAEPGNPDVDDAKECLSRLRDGISSTS